MEVSVIFSRFIATIAVVTDLIKTDESTSIFNMYDIVSNAMNFTMARLECERRGFHGLAIISSPEEFNYAVSITETGRKHLGVWVALNYNSGLNSIMWHDGTEVASDMPWLWNQPQLTTDKPCGRIHISGVMGMIACSYNRFALCGYHNKRFTRGTGSTSKSAMPTGIKNLLTKQQAKSYLHCVLHCSRHYTCRFAWFGSKSSDCILIGPGGFDTLQNNDDGQMFVRTEYATP